MTLAYRKIVAKEEYVGTEFKGEYGTIIKVMKDHLEITCPIYQIHLSTTVHGQIGHRYIKYDKNIVNVPYGKWMKWDEDDNDITNPRAVLDDLYDQTKDHRARYKLFDLSLCLEDERFREANNLNEFFLLKTCLKKVVDQLEVDMNSIVEISSNL